MGSTAGASGSSGSSGISSGSSSGSAGSSAGSGSADSSTGASSTEEAGASALEAGSAAEGVDVLPQPAINPRHRQIASSNASIFFIKILLFLWLFHNLIIPEKCAGTSFNF